MRWILRITDPCGEVDDRGGLSGEGAEPIPVRIMFCDFAGRSVQALPHQRCNTIAVPGEADGTEFQPSGITSRDPLGDSRGWMEQARWP